MLATLVQMDRLDHWGTPCQVLQVSQEVLGPLALRDIRGIQAGTSPSPLSRAPLVSQGPPELRASEAPPVSQDAEPPTVTRENRENQENRENRV